MKYIYMAAGVNMDNILKQGNIKLVDEFEAEFIKLENEKETNSMIIYTNRDLIRKVFQLVILVNGSDATLYDIQNCLYNSNGICRKFALYASRMDKSKLGDFNIDKLIGYFLNEYIYYNKKYSDEFIFSKPLRYTIDRIIESCENNNYSLREKIYNNETIDNSVSFKSKSISFEVDNENVEFDIIDIDEELNRHNKEKTLIEEIDIKNISFDDENDLI